MRAPRKMTGPRKASDRSNTGGKSRAAPAKPTSKPINKMPTRSVGKPVGKRVGRSTPTTRSKPSTPKQSTRRVDSRGNVSSTPTRKTTSAPSAANKRNAAKDTFLSAYQSAMGKRQEGIKPSNYKAQTRRPTTSSRSSLAQKPAERKRNPMTGSRSAYLSRMARGRRR